MAASDHNGNFGPRPGDPFAPGGAHGRHCQLAYEAEQAGGSLMATKAGA
jgi:hypothetical protein